MTLKSLTSRTDQLSPEQVARGNFSSCWVVRRSLSLVYRWKGVAKLRYSLMPTLLLRLDVHGGLSYENAQPRRGTNSAI